MLSARAPPPHKWFPSARCYSTVSETSIGGRCISSTVLSSVLLGLIFISPSCSVGSDLYQSFAFGSVRRTFSGSNLLFGLPSGRSVFLRISDSTLSDRLMSTQSVAVDVGARRGVTPRVQWTAGDVAGSILPPARCMIPATPRSSLRVSPYAHHNRWQCLESVSDCVTQGMKEWKDDGSDDSEAGFGCGAVDVVSDSTVTVSGASLASLDVEEVVPPVKEAWPPDPAYRSRRSLYRASASTSRLYKKWTSLRMGGRKVKGKSTGTVAAYTALFLRCLRAFTAHDVQSSDVDVMGRYVAGIRLGHVALYRVMVGKQQLLLYETLQEAIDAAEHAEALFNISGMSDRSPVKLSPALVNKKTGPGMAEETGKESGQDAHTEAAFPSPSCPPLQASIRDGVSEDLPCCESLLGGRTQQGRSQTQGCVMMEGDKCGRDSESHQIQVRERCVSGSSTDECKNRLETQGILCYEGVCVCCRCEARKVGGTRCVPFPFNWDPLLCSDSGGARGAVPTEKRCFVSIQSTAADDGVDEWCTSLVNVIRTRETEAPLDCLRLRQSLQCGSSCHSDCSALSTGSAELADLRAAGRLTPMLARHISMDGCVRAVSFRIGRRCRIELSRSGTSCRALTVCLSHYHLLSVPCSDDSHDDMEALSRLRGTVSEGSTRPSSTEFGTASVVVIAEIKDSVAMAVSISESASCGVRGAVWIDAGGCGWSASRALCTMKPVVGEEGQDEKSNCCGVTRSVDWFPTSWVMMFRVVVIVTARDREGRTTARLARSVSSSRVIERGGGETMMEGENYRSSSANIAASAASIISLTVAVAFVVAVGRCDVGSVLTRLMAVAGRVEGRAHQMAGEVVDCRDGVALGSMWAARVEDQEIKRSLSSSILGRVVSPTRDREQRNGCSAVGLRLISCGMVVRLNSEVDSAVVGATIILEARTGSNEWALLAMMVTVVTVTVGQDCYAAPIVTGRLCIAAVAYDQCSDVGMEESSHPLSVLVAGLAHLRVVMPLELCAAYIADWEGLTSKALQMDLGSMCCGGMAVSTVESEADLDGRKGWKAMSFSSDGLAASQCETQQALGWMNEKMGFNTSIVVCVPCVADVPDSSCIADERASITPSLWMSNQLQLSGSDRRDVAEFSSVTAVPVKPLLRLDQSQGCIGEAFVMQSEGEGLETWRHHSFQSVTWDAVTASVESNLSSDGLTKCGRWKSMRAVPIPTCSVMALRAVQQWLTTGGAQEPPRTVMISVANDDVGHFERRWSVKMCEFSAVGLKADEDGWCCSSTGDTTCIVRSLIRFGDERQQVMIPLTSYSGRYAAPRNSAAVEGTVVTIVGYAQRYGRCRRPPIAAALQCDAGMDDILICECGVWGRGLSSRPPTPSRFCVGRRTQQGLVLSSQAVANGTAENCREDMARKVHQWACRLGGPFPVAGSGTGNVTVDLRGPGDMRFSDVASVDRGKRYASSVGEWPGQWPHNRPPAVRVAGDGTSSCVIDLEALLGEQEELEYPSDSLPAGSNSEDCRQMKGQEMILRYLFLWKCYSMDDCSWERDRFLPEAQRLVTITDDELRLLAEESGKLNAAVTVVLWCGGASRAMRRSRFPPNELWKGLCVRLANSKGSWSSPLQVLSGEVI